MKGILINIVLAISISLMVACGGAKKAVVSQSEISQANSIERLEVLYDKIGKTISESSGSSKKEAMAIQSQIVSRLVSLSEQNVEKQLSNKTPYDLTSFSYPVGLGYRFPLNNGSILSFELMMRKTDTDYIDDVSGTYADPNQIAASGGAIAAILADRSTSTIPGFSAEGAIRGDPTDNDNFSMFLITYSMPLSKGSGSGFGKNKRRGGLRFKKGKCFEF